MINIIYVLEIDIPNNFVLIQLVSISSSAEGLKLSLISLKMPKYKCECTELIRHHCVFIQIICHLCVNFMDGVATGNMCIFLFSFNDLVFISSRLLP